MSNAHDVSHGNTVAAWTGVGIILLASLLICLGLVLGVSLLWIPGVILVPVGAFAWAALNKAGYGEKEH